MESDAEFLVCNEELFKKVSMEISRDGRGAYILSDCTVTKKIIWGDVPKPTFGCDGYVERYPADPIGFVIKLRARGDQYTELVSYLSGLLESCEKGEYCQFEIEIEGQNDASLEEPDFWITISHAMMAVVTGIYSDKHNSSEKVIEIRTRYCGGDA